MFIVFWDTGSHIFQSDPNNNSDSTAYSDMNLNRIRIAAVGSDLFQVGSQRNRARFKVIGSELFSSGPIEFAVDLNFGEKNGILVETGPDPDRSK